MSNEMTLRDCCAVHCAAGMLASTQCEYMSADDIAVAAYEMADALVRARDRAAQPQAD